MIQRRDERKEGGRYNRNIKKKTTHKKREIKNKVGREIGRMKLVGVSENSTVSNYKLSK